MKKTATKSFIAAVHEDYTHRINDVANRLQDKGCKIDQILKVTGVITGRVSKTVSMSDLKIEGIQSVEIQKKIRKI